MSWAFVMRQTTGLCAPGDVERAAGSIPTVHRLGYALGAAYVGIFANATGFGDLADLDGVARTARTVFASCLPIAAIGLIACARFVYLGTRDRYRDP